MCYQPIDSKRGRKPQCVANDEAKDYLDVCFYGFERLIESRWHVGSAVLCSRHDNLCYTAYLYLIYFYFNELGSK